MKKLISLCLLLCCIGTLLIACKDQKQQPEVTTEEPTAGVPSIINPDAFLLANCQITRPVSNDELYRDLSRSVNIALNQKSGVSVTMADDYSAAKEGAWEILIGKTNRDESTQVLGELSGSTFAFTIRRVNNNRLVIVGTTEEMTATGVLYFVEEIVPRYAVAGGALNMPADFSYVSDAAEVKVVENSTTSYSVLSAAETYSQFRTTVLKDVADALKQAASQSTVTVTKDNVPAAANRNPDTKEIVVGATYYEETKELSEKVGYNQYGVAVRGNKIVVFGYTTDTLEDAVELFERIVKRNAKNGQLSLPDGMTVIRTDYDMKMDIPSFPVIFQDVVEVGGDSYMAYISNANEEAFDQYATLLEKAGLTLYAENTIGTCRFVTYIADKKTVNVLWDSSDSTVRVTCDNSNNRPLTAEADTYNKVCEPLLTQVGLTYLKADTGMSYTMRLADGRFVVIDGGCKDYDEAKQLYDILKSQCVNGGEPVIAAWILTHAHSDHYEAFLDFAGTYGMVKIESVIYNLPTEGFNASLSSTVSMLENKIKLMGGAKPICARTGQVFHMGGAAIEILLTPDDFYPAAISDQNDTTVVFKITVDGQEIMILGDSQYQSAPILLRRYKGNGFNELKSDIMQMAHHGYDGVDSLYRAIDPTIVLWPSPDHWFHESQRYDLVVEQYNSKRWQFNKYIVTSKKVTEIFNSGHGTVTLQLPYTSPTLNRVHPDTPPKVYNKGDVIYTEDFENVSSLYQTGWWTVYSLVESYQYADLSIEKRDNDNGVLINAEKKTNSVTGFIRPDLLAGVKQYTLELELTVDELGDSFGIWYNDYRPIESKDRMLYQLSRTGEFTLRLEVDNTAGTTKVYINNVLQTTLTNTSNGEGGIQFLATGSTVFVGRVTLKAGVS